MSTATNTSRGRTVVLPHQRQRDARPGITQPPTKFAHLEGDELHEALTTDPEIWDAWRFAAEAGRTKRAVDKWVGNYNKYVAGTRPLDDYTITPPTYYGQTPTWVAGEARAWLMRTGKMRRDGVYIPNRPPGRTRGLTEDSPRRRRPTELDKVAPAALKEYRALVDTNGPHKLSAPDARLELAAKLGINERQVIRRLQRARDLENGRRRLLTQPEQ
jgi:hypothetical protein